MASQWLSNKTLHYILGGDPHHTQEFENLPVEYESSEVQDDDYVEGERMHMDDCIFPDEVVMLGDYHKMAHRPVKVNLQLSMSYIISEADQDVIFENQFVEENWHIITLIAKVIEPVDLFSLLKKKVSVGIEQYKPLAVIHLRKISIYSNHQQ